MYLCVSVCTYTCLSIESTLHDIHTAKIYCEKLPSKCRLITFNVRDAVTRFWKYKLSLIFFVCFNEILVGSDCISWNLIDHFLSYFWKFRSNLVLIGFPHCSRTVRASSFPSNFPRPENRLFILPRNMKNSGKGSAKKMGKSQSWKWKLFGGKVSRIRYGFQYING